MAIDADQITPDDDEITKWFDALENNHERAQEVIWDNFFTKMMSVAGKKMHSLPSAARDEEDVALSAMNSFFKRAEAGEFEITNRDELWRLLVTITVRKASAERRRQYAAKRGGGVQRVQRGSDDAVDPLERIVDANRMPELAKDVRNACGELLQSLHSEPLERTAEMKMAGHSNEEISDTLGCTLEQTKYRLKTIRERWKKYYDQLSG